MTRRALVFGECVIDVFPDEEVVAGSPLHVACHLAARGWGVMLVSRVGRDEAGDAVVGTLTRYGVETSLIERDERLPTGRVTVKLSDTDHSFEVDRPSAWDAIKGPTEVPAYDAICYGTLAGRMPGSRRSLQHLLADRRKGSMSVLDMNLRSPDVNDELLATAIQAATVVKCTSDELEEAAQIVGLSPEPEAYFQATTTLEWLCVTHGAAGSDLYRRDGSHDMVAGANAEIVDTVGAGDAFTAGLIDALAGGLDGRVALNLATSVAAGALSRRGGLPPAPGEDEERPGSRR